MAEPRRPGPGSTGRKRTMLDWTGAGLAALALSLVSAGSALAGCLDGPWPLEHEAAVMADSTQLDRVESGAKVALVREAAVTLALVPLASAPLPKRPARGDGTGSAGYLWLNVREAGLYQVTVPEAVWLDMVVEAAPLVAEAFMPARDCPGVRKSVRFRLPAGDALLQVSRTTSSSLPVVITFVR